MRWWLHNFLSSRRGRTLSVCGVAIRTFVGLPRSVRVAGAEVSEVGGKVYAIHGGDFSYFKDEVVRFWAMLEAAVTV